MFDSKENYKFGSWVQGLRIGARYQTQCTSPVSNQPTADPVVKCTGAQGLV